MIAPAVAQAQITTTTIPAGIETFDVVVNPVTNKIYVATADGPTCPHVECVGKVLEIDGDTNTTTTILVASGVGYLAVNPATNRIYTSTGTSVVVIDGVTHATTAVPIGAVPIISLVNPITNRIYVLGQIRDDAGNRSGDKLVVIDGDTNAVTTIATTTITQPVGGDSLGPLAVDPTTNRIYVLSNPYCTGSCPNAPGSLIVVDGLTNATTTLDAGSFPVELALNPATNKVYVLSGYGAGIVTVIDGITHAATTLTVPQGYELVGSMTVNPITNKVYVFSRLYDSSTYIGQRVVVIDGDTNAITAFPVPGFDPNAAVLNVVTNKIYASDGTNVTLIDNDSSATTSLPDGNVPTALAVNTVTSKTYVVNHGLYPDYVGSVTVLAELPVDPLPLVTEMTPLPGNVTSESAPTFNFTTSSTFAPTAPVVQKVFYQVDSAQGKWLPAGGTAPNFSAQLSALTIGSHVLYAWAYDGTGTTGVAKYPFTVVVPQATLSVNCAEVAFDGNPHSCAGSATGKSGAAVSGSWSFSPASATNAGSYAVTGTFTSSDSNYAGGTATSTLRINPATPTLTLTCTEVVYDGNPHSCTGAAKGIGGATVNGTWSFTPASAANVGSYPVTGSFTSSDINYYGGTAHGTLKIDADFVLPPTPPAPTVTAGQSKSTTFTVTPANGFTGTISFTCAVPAAMTQASCSATPVQITGTSGADSTLTVTTTGPHQVAALRGFGPGMATLAMLFGFVGLGIPTIKRRRVTLLAVVLVFLLALGATSCGGGSGGGTTTHTDPGTPAGHYNLTITATAGAAVHTMTVPVTVQ